MIAVGETPHEKLAGVSERILEEEETPEVVLGLEIGSRKDCRLIEPVHDSEFDQPASMGLADLLHHYPSTVGAPVGPTVAKPLLNLRCRRALLKAVARQG